MELHVDPGQGRRTVAPFEPAHPWAPLTVDDDTALVGSRDSRSSYEAECECPDDCLRDHPNE